MAKVSKLEKIYKVDYEGGYFLFKLNSLIDENKITKNSLIGKTEIDFNSIQRLITGNLTRIDLGIIAKLCDEFDCKIEDLVEYINKNKK